MILDPNVFCSFNEIELFNLVLILDNMSLFENSALMKHFIYLIFV